MRKIIMLVTVAMLATVGHGHAQASAPDATATEHSYLDVLRLCGAEWKARADKTVKGMEAWQAFRKECTTGKGWVSKRGGKKGGKGKATDQG